VRVLKIRAGRPLQNEKEKDKQPTSGNTLRIPKPVKKRARGNDRLLQAPHTYGVALRERFSRTATANRAVVTLRANGSATSRGVGDRRGRFSSGYISHMWLSFVE
jgi:hypothetical protein